jgi:hypothetical protein
MSPEAKSFERGFRLFSMKKQPRPSTNYASARARKLELPANISIQAKSARLLTPHQSRSRSPTASRKVVGLVESIQKSRAQRLEVQGLIKETADKKHQKFSQIVKEVKHTFRLKTVEELHRKGQYNLFDKYLSSRELLQYLKSL